MRLCSRCGKPDRPLLDPDGACRKCPPGANEEPATHADGCHRLVHEVVPLVKLAKVIHTPEHPEGELERKWRLEGWVLFKNGAQMFRRRMLCRECIEVEYQRELLHRDYIKACAKLRGQRDKTYYDILLGQA